jgi:phage terminase small subunit
MKPKDDVPRAFPQVATANKLGMLLTKLEQEFGMTPSARTRIEVPTQSEYDPMLDGNPFQEFLARSRAANQEEPDA